MKDNSKCFGINDTYINKIRISEKSLYSKQHNAYKYYVLYEHNNKYMLFRITLKDLVGYYDVYNDDKRMNFKIKMSLVIRFIKVLKIFLSILRKN